MKKYNFFVLYQKIGEFLTKFPEQGKRLQNMYKIILKKIKVMGKILIRND